MDKAEKPTKWDSLIMTGEGAHPKPSNMVFWWDQHEKHEKELDKHTKSIGEDEPV
jgi:hypothetical protein